MVDVLDDNKKKKVVVIGGGTGTYTLLSGLRQYANEIEISAVVTMADSGGSTGRLRDEFGYLPVGDVRQALVALAPVIDEEVDILRELFLYRFDRGEGLSGHTMGNLLLTALTEILGSEILAIESASRLLRTAGSVIPVTTDDVHLQAHYDTGHIITTEHAIDVPTNLALQARIKKLSLTSPARIYEKAREAIVKADLIVLGPGDFYTSILANCIVEGVAEAINEGGDVVFVANLMARAGQTIGMELSDYMSELNSYLGFMPQHVIVPDTRLPEYLLKRYKTHKGVHPVNHDVVDPKYIIHKLPIISTAEIKSLSGDTLPRSLIRHDSKALAAAVHALLHSV